MAIYPDPTDPQKSTTIPADALLLKGCRAGDKQAWLALIDKYECLIYSIPRNHQLTSEDCADITQIVFTALLQSLHTLWDDSDLSNWLILVTRRYTWRTLQVRQVEAAPAIDQAKIRPLFPDQLAEIDRCKIVKWLNVGFWRIDAQSRSLLLTYYFDEKKAPYAELAPQFEQNLGRFRISHAQALQELQLILTPSAPFPSIENSGTDLDLIQLVGWIEESLSPAEVAKVAQRVADGDEELQKQVAWLKAFVWLSQHIIFARPPHSVHLELVRRFVKLTKSGPNSILSDAFLCHPLFLTSNVDPVSSTSFTCQIQYLNIKLPPLLLALQ